MNQFSSVQFISVAQLCPTLRPHELQHVRPPCPSPTSRVHSNISEGSQNWSRGCCHPPRWLRRHCEHARSKVNRKQDCPDSRGAYGRNGFLEPRGLHLPLHSMLNSITWELIFDVQTACSFCCKLEYSLTSPLASLEQFSQSYGDAVSWAQSTKHSNQIK